jgi:predicted MFS family arabinose efflux permease
MLPLNLFSDRNRSGSYLAVLFIGGGLMATYYLLTLFMQQVLQFTPVMAGLASLPVSIGIVLAAGVSTKLVERFAPRVVAVPGLLIAAVGMYLLSLLGPDSSYFSHVLPALFVTYFGLGMGFLPLTLTAVQGVHGAQTGAASALLNASQQIGAALGVSVLGTISTLVAERLLPQASTVLQQGLASGDTSRVAAASSALTQGYMTAFLVAAASLIVAAAIVAVLVNTRQRQRALATVI